MICNSNCFDLSILEIHSTITLIADHKDIGLSDMKHLLRQGTDLVDLKDQTDLYDNSIECV